MTITIESFLKQAPKLLVDWQPEHTPIQLEHFVIGNSGCGDVYGKYVQAMRELDGRYQGLQAMQVQQESQAIDLEVAEIDLEEARVLDPAAVGARRAALTIRKAELAVEIAQMAIAVDKPRRAAALREAATLIELATKAREEVGELTPERRLELEWDFTAARFAQQIELKRMAGQPVSQEIMVSIDHFPDKQKQKLIQAMRTVVGTAAHLRDPMQAVLQLACEAKDRRDGRNAAAVAGGG